MNFTLIGTTLTGKGVKLTQRPQTLPLGDFYSQPNIILNIFVRFQSTNIEIAKESSDTKWCLQC